MFSAKKICISIFFCIILFPKISENISMNILDIVLIIPMLWFAYKGYKNGFIMEMIILLALVAGLFVAARFSYYIEGKLHMDKQYVGAVSYAITFLLVVIGIILLGKLLDNIIKAVALGVFNRIMGLIFGVIKITLIMSVLIYFFNMFDKKHTILPDKTRNASLFFKPVEWIAPHLIPTMTEFVKQQTSS